MAVINLNQFRKRKQREAERKQADDNARRHGRTKAETQSEAAERRRLEDAVDGARLESDAEPRKGEDAPPSDD